MVKLFCSEVQVADTTFETMISVFTRYEGTSFVINVKEMRLAPSVSDDEAQRLLAEELQEAISRFYQKSNNGTQLRAV
ncbi:hypothetical protein [Flaviaesturariibacter amylovorans]|uniref:Uncharacterized protein n=1 Tax=Flaviaesturariibacter amylovorans TaxID=1084520 RepID=A0ABP8HUN6_9BACT